MRRPARQTALAWLTILAVIWCPVPGAAQGSPNEVLAVVNGEAITADRVDAELRSQLTQLEQQARRLRETMLVKLIEHSGPLDEAGLLSLAGAQGLRAAEFAQCLKDPTAAERVQRDIELGRRAGVAATPTFFVNGRRVADFAQLETAIEEALQHAQANPP